MSADPGQRNVWLHEPAHAAFWEVATKLRAYDDWGGRFPVQLAVGTRLRLRQADGLWIGLEFDNPGWYHLEVLDGPSRGRCVVVDAIWPRYELPAELREAAEQ